jgi:hypothetical protein
VRPFSNFERHFLFINIMNEQEKKPSNPSAFPEPYANDPSSAISHTKGMTLRDYFANSAMQGILSTFNDQTSFDTFGHVAKDLAEKSYLIADAMLKAREL